MTSDREIVIFTYTNYRLFLRDYIDANYLQKGKSYRAFSKRCSIGSPNYFQKIIASEKNMTAQMAGKIAFAMGLKKNSFHYFVNLVRLERAKDADERFELLETLERILAKQKKRTVKDEKFHSRWTHQVIWNLAHTENFVDDPVAIRQALRGTASLQEIEKSLFFLKNHGYLKFDPEQSRFIVQDIKIETDNDFRNLNLQKNHNRFLQIAQLRLNDDILKREMQGLTIALTSSQLPKLKQHMRDFISKMVEILDEPRKAEYVLRLQMAAIVVADPMTPNSAHSPGESS